MAIQCFVWHCHLAPFPRSSAIKTLDSNLDQHCQQTFQFRQTSIDSTQNRLLAAELWTRMRATHAYFRLLLGLVEIKSADIKTSISKNARRHLKEAHTHFPWTIVCSAMEMNWYQRVFFTCLPILFERTNHASAEPRYKFCFENNNSLYQQWEIFYWAANYFSWGFTIVFTNNVADVYDSKQEGYHPRSAWSYTIHVKDFWPFQKILKMSMLSWPASPC